MELIKGRILIVDDEQNQLTLMQEAVRMMGYEVEVTPSGARALDLLRESQFDILITDMQMPEMDGLTLLENARTTDSGVSVVVLTAHGTIETAVEAMKRGAEDYITKPVEFAELEMTLQLIFSKRRLLKENEKLAYENEALKRDLGIRYHYTNAIGRSPHTQTLLKKIEGYLGEKAPILILGERGAGVDDIARMLHYNGPCAQNSLFFFDCAAVPEDLHEVNLFGQETAIEAGAKIPGRPGLIERANNGTLVLSNIQRLNKQARTRLARVLKQEETQRTGGKQFYAVSLRVLATSSHAELDSTLREDGFRWELFDIFMKNKIEIKPLRERREDVPLLITAIANRVAIALGKNLDKVEQAVFDKLSVYDFPGNDRELESLVESAVIRCDSNILKVSHFFFL